MPPQEMKDVIVLLPGILGSVLTRKGKPVWGLSAGALGSALWNMGSNITDLQIPPDGVDDPAFDDGVVATGLMPDLHLIPWFWKIDGYGKIRKTLFASFNLIEGKNYFEFPYDWRLDNRMAAQKLARLAHTWLANWRNSSNPDAKLILVGHSMGGIIARYFLECLEGWRDTRMLITFGTPYRGSLNALDYISNGLKKKIGPIELINLSEMLRSFTSVYQLLPIYDCYDIGDGKLIGLSQADNIPQVNIDRVRTANDFHFEIIDAADRNKQESDYIRSPYEIHPIVGLFQPTGQSARLTGNKVKVLGAFDGTNMEGDGTVPRVSATPYEKGSPGRPVFANAVHSSLQNTDSVLVQLEGLLSGLAISHDLFAPVRRTKDFVGEDIGLQIDDAYATDEPIEISARSEGSYDLVASVADTNTGVEIDRKRMEKNVSDWQNIEFGPLPAGTYRLIVSQNEKPANFVSDIFAVLPV